MSTASRELYRITGIKHGYSSGFSLDIDSLIIREGSAVGFAGPNGSGKSTLFRLLAFLENPVMGTIEYPVNAGKNSAVAARKEVTLLLQEPYLLKRTVFENLAYGLRVRGIRDNLKSMVYEALEYVGLTPGLFSRRQWFQLSGGEARRVAIASRIILKPKVLILDEPFSNIDQESISQIKNAIMKIRDKYNTTLIISSHDRVWLNNVSDEIHLLNRGLLAGSAVENVIPGPWLHFSEELWFKDLPNNGKIFTLKPPKENSTALIHPSEILISPERPISLSAENILEAVINNMTPSSKTGNVYIEAVAHDTTFICSLTRHVIRDLEIFPGKQVWLIFEASSFHWQ